MAQVVRFILSDARSAGIDVFVRGAGYFRRGVLDIAAGDTSALAAVRAAAPHATETGPLDDAVAPPPPPAGDPYPEYIKYNELVASIAGGTDEVALQLKAASVAAVLESPDAAAALESRSPVSALASTSEDPRITWLSQFGAGHGWTATPAGTATADANNTERPGLSAQAIKAHTVGGNVTVNRTGLTWDLTDRSIVLALQTITPDLVGGFQIFVGDSTLTNYYSLVLSQRSGMHYRAGRHSVVEIPIESMTVTGTPNRAAIARVQIIFLGSLPTTYYLAGIGSRTKHPTWPNGALTLGFDDGYLDHFTVARPKLAERGWPGVAHVIVDQLGTTNFMTVDHLRQMQGLNGWMIAPHSYTVAAHDNRWTSLTADQLAAEARNLHDWMREQGFAGWRHFAAPGGVFSQATTDMAARFFATQRQAGVVTADGMLQTRPLPLTPQWLPSASINTTNLAAVLGLVQKAKDAGLWAQLVFHRFGVASDISQAQFNQLMDDIAAIGIPVVTPMQVMGF